MKAICKKLLSLLVVIAMVLSMVPFGGLSIFAVETKATTTATEETEDVVHSELPEEAAAAINKAETIQEEAATLDFSGNYCPACGPDVEVTWTKLTTAAVGATSGNADVFKTNRHFYWDPADFENGTATLTGVNWLQMTSADTGSGSICLHLNGIKLNLDKGRVHWSDAKVLNIMGSGEVNTGLNVGTNDFYGLFQVDGKGTINLYGGTYTSTDATVVEPSGSWPETTVYGLVGIGTAATFNIYDDVTLQSAGTNVVMSNKGVFNMYGGEIKGGTGYDYAYDGTANADKDGVPATGATYTNVGGNVYLRKTGTTFNMYDGKITGGTASLGGNVMAHWDATFNQYGGEISGGTATATGTDCYGGGNIYVGAIGTDATYRATLTQHGGLISGGSAYQGGSILTKYSPVTINGTVDGGTSTGGGGSVWVSSAGKVGTTTTYKYSDLTVGSTGVIKNGVAAMSGGSVVLYGTGRLYLQGGKIKGGTAGTHGGNIYMTSNGTFQMTGGELSGGIANSTSVGGNLYAQNKGAKITISGGTVSGGEAKNGGNLYISKAKVEVSGDALLSGGTAANGGQGGNIYLTGANTDAKDEIGTLTISGNAQITGGSATYGKTIRMQPYSALVMTGGTIDGQIQPTDGACTAKTATITVSGEAKITGTGLQCGQNGILLADAGLTGTASIAVYALNRPFVQYADEATATAAKGFYKASQSGYGVVVNADGTLMIGEVVNEPVVGVFDPENCDGKAYCPVCGTLETWKDFNSYAYTGVQGHYYLNDHLTKDASQPVTVSSGTGCFNLNGYTLSMNGRVGLTAANTTLNIMDTAGGGVITTTGTRTEDDLFNHTFSVQSTNTTLNLYGGTFKNTNANGGDYAVVRVGGSGNELNIYEGAIIDGCGKAQGVNVVTGTLKLDGGIIQNGISANGGNVEVASGQTFEMKSGTIKDGQATAVSSNGGGNIYSAGTVDLYGGEISGGQSSYAGGNIHIAGGTFTIGDGAAADPKVPEITVKDGKTGVVINGNSPTEGWGGNIYISSNGTLNIQDGALITDGNSNTNANLSKVNYGGNIAVGGSSKVYMYGGTVTEGTSYRGGNFDLSGAGTLEITGGTVSDGTSTSGGGGNIFFQNASAKVTISGSNTTISGGEAPYGGSIRANGGTLKIQGGIISGGTATGSAANSGLGGNIYISGATMEMTDGTITGGTANWIATDNGDGSFTYKNGDGGNIYSTNGTLTIQGGTISNGTAGQNGGNILVSGGTFTVKAADSSKPVQFIGGQTKQLHGGNLCLNSTTASIDGAVINGGAAGDGQDYNALIDGKVYHGTTGQGGAIRAYNCGTLEIKNSTVTAGTAIANNQGIWALSCNVSLDNTTVTGVDGAYRGSGVSMVSSGKTLTISGNSSITNADNNALRMANGAILSVAEGWSGNVGIYLEEKAYSAGETVNNASCTGAYTGTLMNSNGDKVAIIADGTSLVLAGCAVVDTANDTTTWTSLEAALAAADGSKTKYLLAGADVTLNGETVYIDALKAINVTGTGTAYGIDPANADFTTKSTGKFSGNVQSDATFDGVRYIKIADGSVHAIEMRLTNVTLRTNEEAGLYYKATYKCDDELAAAIDGYGVALSVHDMPDANFAEDMGASFTYNDGSKFVPDENHEVKTNSGGVFGILKTDNTQAKNQKNLMTEIYANAYIMIGEDIHVADTVNGGKKAGIAYSLYEVLAAINDNYSNYKAEVQDMVAGFYNTWNGTEDGKVNLTQAFQVTTNYTSEMAYTFDPNELAAIAARAAELAAQV